MTDTEKKAKGAPEAADEAPKAAESPKAAEASKETKEAPKEAAPKEAAEGAPKEAGKEAPKAAAKEAPKPAKEAIKSVAPKAPAANPNAPFFKFHVALLCFIALYFSSLAFWFGRLFLNGGPEEHAVMSIVFPVVLVIGSVALITLSTIVFEGRRADREKTEPHSAVH